MATYSHLTFKYFLLVCGISLKPKAKEEGVRHLFETPNSSHSVVYPDLLDVYIVRLALLTAITTYWLLVAAAVSMKQRRLAQRKPFITSFCHQGVGAAWREKSLTH